MELSVTTKSTEHPKLHSTYMGLKGASISSFWGPPRYHEATWSNFSQEVWTHVRAMGSTGMYASMYFYICIYTHQDDIHMNLCACARACVRGSVHVHACASTCSACRYVCIHIPAWSFEMDFPHASTFPNRASSSTGTPSWAKRGEIHPTIQLAAAFAD